MSGQVEDGDLDVMLSMAVVVKAKYRDLMKIREQIRNEIKESKGSRFIHCMISAIPLYVIKQDDWRRLKDLETQHGGEQKNG